MGPKRKQNQSKVSFDSKLNKYQNTLSNYFPNLGDNKSKAQAYQKALKKPNGLLKQGKKFVEQILKVENQIIKQTNKLYKAIFRDANHEDINQFAKIYQHYSSIVQKNTDQQSLNDKQASSEPTFAAKANQVGIASIQNVLQPQSSWQTKSQNLLHAMDEICSPCSSATRTISVKYSETKEHQTIIDWQDFEFKQKSFTGQKSEEILKFKHQRQQQAKYLSNFQDETITVTIKHSKKQILTSFFQLQPKNQEPSAIDSISQLQDQKHSIKLFQKVRLPQNQKNQKRGQSMGQKVSLCRQIMSFEVFPAQSQDQQNFLSEQRKGNIINCIDNIKNHLQEKEQRVKQEQDFNIYTKKSVFQTLALPILDSRKKQRQSPPLLSVIDLTSQDQAQQCVYSSYVPLQRRYNNKPQSFYTNSNSHRNNYQFDPLDAILLRNGRIMAPIQRNSIKTSRFDQNLQAIDYRQGQCPDSQKQVSTNQKSSKTNRLEQGLKQFDLAQKTVFPQDSYQKKSQILPKFNLPVQFLQGFSKGKLGPSFFQSMHNFELQKTKNTTKICILFQ